MKVITIWKGTLYATLNARQHQFISLITTLAQALRPCAGNGYQRIGKDTSLLIVTQFP